jgi:oxygen-dependent protoporphyrinogen oxidase
VLIRLFAGRSGQEEVVELPDEEILGLARSELSELFDIGHQPVWSRTYRWPQGTPQYTLGHLDRRAKIAARLDEHSGLAVAGSAYGGVGIPDCIESGEEAAATVVRHTSARPH